MRPLVPAFLLKKVAGGKTTGFFTACTLFVDIPDFTAITNAVMRYGQYAGIMIIWGEPGIGKSHLLDQLEINADYDLSLILCQTDVLFQDSLNPFRCWLRHYFEQSKQQSDARCRLPHADPLSSSGAN